MPKFRAIVEIDAVDAESLKLIMRRALGFWDFKISKVRGPKHMKGWRATHDARFVKPDSEFGGSCKHPYLSDAACISDSIGPVFKRRADAEWQIRSMMRYGPNHGWSPKRSDYSIHKV
jgi:hypothetical protein